MVSEKFNREYAQLLHAIQSGIKFYLERDPSSGTPKHLRVGIDSAKAEHYALARLLMQKGVITEAEYEEAILEGLRIEVARLESELSSIFNIRVRLA